ncbi:MAG TPA: DUF58 domain-containing protein [Opitutaceae bacterium]|nr:DUF58 domain-containing protein [Opitutaceae bacterium]
MRSPENSRALAGSAAESIGHRRASEPGSVGLRTRGATGRFTWNALLWALVFPQQARRIVPTIPGGVLVALSLGIGMAAYNSSSNILFLTLALLLTCLILSGVLSWLNLRGVLWRLRVAPALRAGHDTMVTVELRNEKSFLPTYGLWFNLVARRRTAPEQQRAESTLTAPGAEVRAVLAEAEAASIRGRVALRDRLDSGGAAQLEWVFQPRRRGRLRIELASVGSLFPFGFLRKDVGTSVASDVVVWPAPVEYRHLGPAAARRQTGDQRVVRAGTGSDLMAVRRYTTGDSHRLIHWKASARTRQLLVRQFAAEIAEGYVVWLQADAGMWPRAEQFELLIRFVATLSEDLFRAERLLSVTINDQPAATVRRVRDLEVFLDRLAVLEPSAAAAGSRGGPAIDHNLLTFVPEGARSVSARVDGQLIALA